MNFPFLYQATIVNTKKNMRREIFLSLERKHPDLSVTPVRMAAVRQKETMPDKGFPYINGSQFMQPLAPAVGSTLLHTVQDSKPAISTGGVTVIAPTAAPRVFRACDKQRWSASLFHRISWRYKFYGKKGSHQTEYTEDTTSLLRNQLFLRAFQTHV